MRSKTQAIVLHLTQHSDSMSVLHLYTRDFGRVDYAVYGVGSKKGKLKKAFLEPLSILDVEVNHQPTLQLQRIDDVQPAYIAHQLSLDIRKRSIAIFIAEVLYNTLRHPMTDEQLFDFLVIAIESLDQCEHPNNFHLSFLVRLSQFLGFFPNLDSGGEWLDLRSGEKQYGLPIHPDVLTIEQTRILESIVASEDIAAADVLLSREQRNSMVDRLILYYSLHVAGFYNPKSLDVLIEIGS